MLGLELEKRGSARCSPCSIPVDMNGFADSVQSSAGSVVVREMGVRGCGSPCRRAYPEKAYSYHGVWVVTCAKFRARPHSAIPLSASRP